MKRGQVSVELIFLFTMLGLLLLFLLLNASTKSIVQSDKVFNSQAQNMIDLISVQANSVHLLGPGSSVRFPLGFYVNNASLFFSNESVSVLYRDILFQSPLLFSSFSSTQLETNILYIYNQNGLVYFSEVELD